VLLDELIRDGDRIVYRARDPLLGRLVAIEAVARDPVAHPSAPAFERKVQLAGGLAHPNVVTVYDAAAIHDVAYIATESVEGQTLRDVLDSGVTLPPAVIERIAAQIADGLDFMHRRGIVHGDVNPSSVAVLDIGFVKLSYLGNALFAMGGPLPGGICATSRYVSPEHVGAAAVDARSDVFSLGSVLYEMLTGVAPFSGSTPRELADAITSEHPRPPSTVNPEIPSRFDYIVARALSKQPEHRYQSAGEMALHLRKWAPEEPTFFTVPRPSSMPVQTALPEASPERSDNVRTRRQWLAYGIPGVVLTVSAAWTMWSRPTPSTESVTSAITETSTPGGSALVHVGDAVPSPAGQAEIDPIATPPAARANALVQRGPAAWLKLAVSPWGEIYVDGQRRGVSPPLTQIELAPGRHRIEIRNASFPPRRESVDVKANARLRIKHKFVR
jgi:serine/threonine-protein kinase